MSQIPPKKQAAFSELSKHSGKVILWAMGASVLFHIGSAINLSYLAETYNNQLKAPRSFEQSKVKVVKGLDKHAKKILEVNQKKTAPPKAASRLGHNDHSTDKETKIDKKIARKKAADAGQKGNQGKSTTKSQKRHGPNEALIADLKKKLLTSPSSKIEISTSENQRRKKFEAILPKRGDLIGQINKGYQDYIEDEVEIGDAIDMNTVEYKYISYFTHMRKAIELAWSYPAVAVRSGMQGAVRVQFIIQKNGKTRRLRVLSSSGYRILDRAIVEAIKDASPLPPLPERFEKKQLLITGSFEYVLNSFAVSH